MNDILKITADWDKNIWRYLFMLPHSSESELILLSLSPFPMNNYFYFDQIEQAPIPVIYTLLIICEPFFSQRIAISVVSIT